MHTPKVADGGARVLLAAHLTLAFAGTSPAEHDGAVDVPGGHPTAVRLVNLPHPLDLVTQPDDLCSVLIHALLLHPYQFMVTFEHGKQIGANNPRAGVQIDDIDAPWWKPRYAGARRVL